MDQYDYLEAVTSDVLEYLNAHDIKVTSSNRDELAEQLHDDLWAEDSVTGNGSGSYTFNTWQAEENLCHNYDLLVEAAREFGTDMGSLIEDGAEACDVTIRCYLLPQAITAALDAVQVDENEDEDEE